MECNWKLVLKKLKKHNAREEKFDIGKRSPQSESKSGKSWKVANWTSGTNGTNWNQNSTRARCEVWVGGSGRELWLKAFALVEVRTNWRFVILPFFGCTVWLAPANREIDSAHKVVGTWIFNTHTAHTFRATVWTVQWVCAACRDCGERVVRGIRFGGFRGVCGSLGGIWGVGCATAHSGKARNWWEIGKGQDRWKIGVGEKSGQVRNQDRWKIRTREDRWEDGGVGGGRTDEQQVCSSKVYDSRSFGFEIILKQASVFGLESRVGRTAWTGEIERVCISS